MIFFQSRDFDNMDEDNEPKRMKFSQPNFENDINDRNGSNIGGNHNFIQVKTEVIEDDNILRFVIILHT